MTITTSKWRGTTTEILHVFFLLCCILYRQGGRELDTSYQDGAPDSGYAFHTEVGYDSTNTDDEAELITSYYHADHNPTITATTSAWSNSRI